MRSAPNLEERLLKAAMIAATIAYVVLTAAALRPAVASLFAQGA